jgi:hypothetical protein
MPLITQAKVQKTLNLREIEDLNFLRSIKTSR